MSKSKAQTSEKSVDMEIIINKAVKQAVAEAIQAGKRLAEQRPVDAYRATEKRLYALPDLKEKLEADNRELAYWNECGPRQRSKDLVRFKRGGVRLSDEQILEAIEQTIAARIAADEFEVKTLEAALAPLTSDPYYRVIEGRYFEQKSDEEMASELHCDASTVRRNRGRLVRRVAVRLYGVEAI